MPALLLALVASSTAAGAASAQVADLGKPVVAGVRLDACETTLSKKADGGYRGARFLPVKGGHFKELGFMGGSDGCYAVGGAVNEEGAAQLPAMVELILRDGTDFWYTTSTPNVYRVREILSTRTTEGLWWVGDFERWKRERNPFLLSDYRGYIATAVGAGDLATAASFAETAYSPRADDWNEAVALPLLDVLRPRVAALQRRFDAKEAPEVVARELDALLPLVPQGMLREVGSLRYALRDALHARAGEARAAGARATEVGLRYLALRMADDGSRATHEALANAALALVPALSPLPPGDTFRVGRAEGMDAVAAAVLGNGGSIAASFPADLPASGSRLVVDSPLVLEVNATTKVGQRTDRIRAVAYDDMRAVLARRSERTQEILAEKARKGAECVASRTVVTAGSSTTRTEQFTESPAGTGLTLSGVREVTTTTEGRSDTYTSYDSACGQRVEAWARSELAALGPVPDAFQRRDTIRTVVLTGEWQTWTGRATRTVRLVAPDGTETRVHQSEPVELGPYLRAAKDGVKVDEWRTEAQVRAEVQARLDAALVASFYAAFDARVTRDAAKLAPEWREQEVGWARWIYGDGPAMASIAPTKFMNYRSRVSEAASAAWDDAIENHLVHTLVPIGDDRWAATIRGDRLVILDGRYNRHGLPLGTIPADSAKILPVPGRPAVVVTDAGMPSLIELSGPEAAWRRVGPGCQEKADLRGFGPDGRVLVRGTGRPGWTGWWDPVTGAVEKLPESVGDAWPWFEAGKVLIFGDGGVDLLEVASGARTRLVTTATRGELSLRQDGRLLAIVTAEGWEVWDVLNGTLTRTGTFPTSPYAYHGRHGAFYGDEFWWTAGADATREPGYTPVQALRDPTLRGGAAGAR